MPSARSDRPWLYGLLIIPSAIVANGVVQGGALSFFLRQSGVGIGQISSIISLLALPTSIYFLWSPITDFLVRRRTWVMLGAFLSGVLLGCALSLPDLSSRLVEILIFISTCTGQLVVSSCGGMMGAITSERTKRTAGSFYQAGSMGFGAVSVSLLIWLFLHHRGWLGLAAGLSVALPGLLALLVHEPSHTADVSYSETMHHLWAEFQSTFLHWRALPYALIIASTQSSGAAVGLLPGVAQDYGVSGDQVAWINGIGGTLLMAAGSLAAALIPVRARASVTYCCIGLVNACMLCILWLGPAKPMIYFVGVALYLFTVGVGYAIFTAVVLEFLGASGKTGSGRYSIINSLGNIPVLVMIKLDGVGAARFGPQWLAGTEAIFAFATAGLLLLYFVTLGRGSNREQSGDGTATF